MLGTNLNSISGIDHVNHPGNAILHNVSTAPLLRFFAKFANSDHQPEQMAHHKQYARYDNDPERHSAIPFQLDYGQPPSHIARLWSPQLRSLGAQQSLSLSSSWQEVILPHFSLNLPSGRGGRAVSAFFPRQGDRMHIPGIFIQAAPIVR